MPGPEVSPKCHWYCKSWNGCDVPGAIVPLPSKKTAKGATPVARLSMGVAIVMAAFDPNVQAGAGGPEGIIAFCVTGGALAGSLPPPPPQPTKFSRSSASHEKPTP